MRSDDGLHKQNGLKRMNKLRIMVVVFAFLLVLVPVCQVRASVSVAFIYSSDLASAESYESLLTANGMTVDLVPSSDAATWDYSSYGLIIIGSDTGSLGQWEPEAAVSAITETSLVGKPILGLGEGGYAFFGKLGLNIGFPLGAHGSYDQIYVLDSDHQVFNSPTSISVPTDKIITLYTSMSPAVVIYDPPSSGVTSMGRSVSSTDYYLILTESPPGKLYVLWGFTESPASMTQTGKDLFVNIVSWLAPQPALQNPSASFTCSPESPKVGETVTFDASGSTDADGTISTYSWDFDDGDTATGETTTHSYSSADTYTVTLTVTDNDELTDTATKDVVVTEEGGDGEDSEPPVANAGNDRTVNAGSTVPFSAASSSDNVGIESYEWDFGDDNTATGITTNHTYDAVGDYIVTLTVTDAAGNSDTVTILITVKEAEAGGFPFWILIPIIIAVIVAVILIWFFFLKKRKPKEKMPKPSKIRVTVDPNELLADGKSKSSIVIELLDAEGKPVSALSDTKIKLVTTKGRIEKPVVKISKGKEKEKTLLVSPKEGGKATLSAIVEDLGSTSVTVTFMEKKRYCMHCGSKMSLAAKHCSVCGKSPPAGVDTKACKNCNAVIPVVAKFCAECGAAQPDQE